MPSSTQTQAGVPLFELVVAVVVPDVCTNTRRVVVCSTVAVVITVDPGAVVVSVVTSVVVCSAARPPAGTATARRAPAAKRATRPESFTAVGTAGWYRRVGSVFVAR